ncbi:MAG: Rrf2 family transcriptional regulator [Proteobacteria bacterium]|nr:Rrf2 family transcriptional regulator [Pseudomonadota bacterium]
MAKILNISEAVSLALHAALMMSANPGRLVSTHEIATALKGSEAHLAKVLQRMVRAGLVESIRGPAGGFRLKKKPSEIYLLEIFEIIEGKLAEDKCLLSSPICPAGSCIFGGMLDSVNRQVREYLTKTRLSEFSNLSLPRKGGKHGQNKKNH